MQPLSVVVDQVREKLKLTGTASVLKYGNSTLDLSTALRFIGLPAGAKLELDTGAWQAIWLRPFKAGNVGSCLRLKYSYWQYC